MLKVSRIVYLNHSVSIPSLVFDGTPAPFGQVPGPVLFLGLVLDLKLVPRHAARELLVQRQVTKSLSGSRHMIRTYFGRQLYMCDLWNI